MILIKAGSGEDLGNFNCSEGHGAKVILEEISLRFCGLIIKVG
jgi:hypothetical protein